VAGGIHREPVAIDGAVSIAASLLGQLATRGQFNAARDAKESFGGKLKHARRLDQHRSLDYNPAMKTFLNHLVLCCAFTLVAGLSSDAIESKEGRIVLFDGKRAEAFRGYKRDSFPEKSWAIENGTLKTIVGGEVIDLITKEKFESFELDLEWKISAGGNSGIIYHVAEDLPHSYNTGPEMQVLDDSKHKDGGNPKTSAGALYALIAPQNKVLKPVGEWNHARLLVRGNHVEHWLNGRKVVEYELGSAALEKMISGSKFKDMPRFAKEKTGHIALQHHRDEVWYRNITIRKL